MVDCSKENFGCRGGWSFKAMEHVISKGVDTQANYPYTARQGTCKNNKDLTKIVDFTKISNKNMYQFLISLSKAPVTLAFRVAGTF